MIGKRKIVGIVLCVVFLASIGVSSVATVEDKINSVEDFDIKNLNIPEKNQEGKMSILSISKSKKIEPAFKSDLRTICQIFPDQEYRKGLDMIKANGLQLLGYSGKNITIAVIDAGFKGLENNPEIPMERIVEAVSYRDDGIMDADKHGTAVIEKLLEVAPNASYYLIVIETEKDFEEAINYSIEKKADIIHMSAGFTAGPFNGTGFLCETANKAEENGIIFVKSAGNYAKKHFEWPFKDADKDNLVEYDPDTIEEGLCIGYIKKGEPISVTLSWNNWPESCEDYDLHLVNSASSLIATSVNTQNNSEPAEIISGIIQKDGYYYLLVQKYNATGNSNFELYSQYQNLEYRTAESSLSIPGDAQGVITVGALDSNDIIESFSSRGPTNDGRIEPNLMATNGMPTFIYGTEEKFAGTSASAIYITGGTALLLEILESINKSMSPQEIRNLLEISAKDLGKSGKDNLYGAGRINITKAYEILCPPELNQTVNFSESTITVNQSQP